MTDSTTPRELIIKGVTVRGDTFRPSDWAERLCGVLAAYRPGYVATHGPVLGYSPYVQPTMIGGVRAVVVDPRLHGLEPRAWDFVVGFARDNELVTLDAAALVAAPTLPDDPAGRRLTRDRGEKKAHSACASFRPGPSRCVRTVRRGSALSRRLRVGSCVGRPCSCE